MFTTMVKSWVAYHIIPSKIGQPEWDFWLSQNQNMLNNMFALAFSFRLMKYSSIMQAHVRLHFHSKQRCQKNSRQLRSVTPSKVQKTSLNDWKIHYLTSTRWICAIICTVLNAFLLIACDEISNDGSNYKPAVAIHVWRRTKCAHQVIRQAKFGMENLMKTPTYLMLPLNSDSNIC